MHNMVCFYVFSVCPVLTNCKAAGLRVLTRGEHALNEVVDIAEDNSEALWGALLPHQRLDLDALQYRLRYSGIGICTGVEYGTEEQRKYLAHQDEVTLTHASEP